MLSINYTRMHRKIVSEIQQTEIEKLADSFNFFLLFIHPRIFKCNIVLDIFGFTVSFAQIHFPVPLTLISWSCKGTCQKLLRYAVKRKKRYYLGIFPNMGGGVFPNPKTFVNLPSIFLYAKFILRC